MNTNTDSKLQEQISHTTDSAPYSVHYTRVPADTDPALYLHWHNEMKFLYLVFSSDFLISSFDTYSAKLQCIKQYQQKNNRYCHLPWI